MRFAYHLIIGFLIGALFTLSANVAFAAPTWTNEVSLIPQLNNTYTLGTTTKYWKEAYITSLCLSGDCQSTWPSGGSGFSTTSADYWKTQRNFYSTTSTAYDLSTYDKGFFFSTTSTNYWESTQSRWATTSANYHASVGLSFSSTSASYFLSQNTGNAFSTTSANFWRSAGLSFSTTSSNYWASVGLGHSTTSVAYQLAQNITLGNATSTNFFATLASSTNLFAGNATTSTFAVANLNAASCDVKATTSGSLYCGTDATGGGGGAWPFTPTDHYATSTQATTSPLYLLNGPLFASTSIYIDPQQTLYTGYISDHASGATIELDNAISLTGSTVTLNSADGLFRFTATETGRLNFNSLTDLRTYTFPDDTGTLCITSLACDGQFSTTSADYWKTQNNFYSTTSANFWSSVGLGFSTTSNNYWSSLGLAFSTTSANAWRAVGLSFSTTSSDYWEAQQTARTADDLSDNVIDELQDVNIVVEDYGDVLRWNGTGWADAATSTLYNTAASGVTGLLSGTDWTTFNNKAPTASPTFTGTATFANLTATNATTTTLFTTFASTTNGTSTRFFTNYASTTNLFALNATSSNLDITGLLTFNGVTGSTWASFCTTITGSAGLCDGNDAGGAGGSPGGSDTHVQFNDGGSFGGSSQFLFNKATSQLSIGTSSPMALVSIGATSTTGVGSPLHLFSISSSTAGTATSSIFTVTNDGRVLIGTTTANPIQASNPAFLVVDTGNSTTEEAANFIGNVNDFLEINVKNLSVGTAAQACVSATSNQGTDLTGFLAICTNNSSFWNPQFYNVGGAGDTSLMALSTGELFIGNAATSSRANVHIFAGGVSTSTNGNIRLSILGTNGNVGVGSSTPWAKLSIISTSTELNRPILSVATSSDSWGQLFSVFGTTTYQSSLLNPLSYVYDSGARVVIGALNYLSNIGPLDQLFVNGRISTGDWIAFECNSNVAGLSADAGISGCTGFVFAQDANASLRTTSDSLNDAMFGTEICSANGTCSALASAAGNAGAVVALSTSNSTAISFATSTPVFESVMRITTPTNATSSYFYFGFVNTNVAGSTFELEPTGGCFFMASTSLANWQAICRTSIANTTIVDTGFASSTSATTVGRFQRFRISADVDGVDFYMGSSTAPLRQVARITTNVSTTTTYNAGLFVAHLTAGLAKGIEFNRIKLWLNQPISF